MSLFPFLQEEQKATNPMSKLHKEYDFNFESGQLSGKVLEDKEALKVWIYKALLTRRYKHVIYRWDYGQDLDEIIGQGYDKGLICSEVERRIKDCLVVNEQIKACNHFNIELDGSQLNVTFTVDTIYGEVEMNVNNI